MLSIRLNDVHQKNIDDLIKEIGEQNKEGIICRYVKYVHQFEENPHLNGDTYTTAFKLAREELRVEYKRR
jgi:hypothetical protein